MKRERRAADSTETERPSALVLVRCWVESAPASPPVVRGYLRDLRSGDEIAIGDVDAIEEHVRRLLRLPRAVENEELIA